MYPAAVSYLKQPILGFQENNILIFGEWWAHEKMQVRSGNPLILHAFPKPIPQQEWPVAADHLESPLNLTGGEGEEWLLVEAATVNTRKKV